MTREQIEKASRDYISDVYPDDGYFVPDFEEGVRNGFMAGAEWRINSVWHDLGKEMPKCNRHVVNESINCIGGVDGAYVIVRTVTCLRSTKAKKKQENIYKED